MTNWKLNDFCFWEYELVQITEIKDGRIREVTTGYISAGSSDFSDRILPITIKTKIISEAFKEYSNRLHSMNCGLNYPDIHRYLVNKWYEACLLNNNEAIKIIYDEINKFILDLKEITYSKTVNGIKVFR
jgi:hypothetical protein